MHYKIGALKSFVWKNLHENTCAGTSQNKRLNAALLKRDSTTGVSLGLLWHFLEHTF